MNKTRFQIIVLGVILGLVLGACSVLPATYLGTELDEPLEVPDFTLTDQYGEPFTLSEQKGNVVMLFFGYTSCPDVCPTTLASWKKVEKELDKNADQVRFVFITVDPARDSPERLGMHVNAFSPDFIGLTGNEEELAPIFEFFSVVRDKQEVPDSALGYLINHTSSSFLLDPDGIWQLKETYGTEAKDIAHDIQLLLKP